MKISFTICSANYLPYAKSLGDSLINHNTDHIFIIVLVDKANEEYNATFAPHTIINVEDMQLEFFAEMNDKYDIFELSCALKPFAADYIFKNKTACSTLFYFDADILIFNSLENAEKQLEHNAILLTPHLLTKNDFDDRIEIEKMIFRAGIFNAGFFGLQRDPETQYFLNWWMKKMKDYSFNDIANGLFVDQLWLNFVPQFFKKIVILTHMGYNVAYWNIAERKLTRSNDEYFINQSIPLVFFHYSGHSFENEHLLSKHFPLYTFENKPVCKALFAAYKLKAIENGLEGYSKLKPFFGTSKPIIIIPSPPVREKNFFKRKYKKWFKKKK